MIFGFYNFSLDVIGILLFIVRHVVLNTIIFLCLMLSTMSTVAFCLLQEEVCSKIEDAFCPLKYAKCNPCLEYIKYIILPWFGKFEVLRTGENSGIK